MAIRDNDAIPALAGGGPGSDIVSDVEIRDLFRKHLQKRTSEKTFTKKDIRETVRMSVLLNHGGDATFNQALAIAERMERAMQTTRSRMNIAGSLLEGSGAESSLPPQGASGLGFPAMMPPMGLPPLLLPSAYQYPMPSPVIPKEEGGQGISSHWIRGCDLHIIGEGMKKRGEGAKGIGHLTRMAKIRIGIVEGAGEGKERGVREGIKSVLPLEIGKGDRHPHDWIVGDKRMREGQGEGGHHHRTDGMIEWDQWWQRVNLF